MRNGKEDFSRARDANIVVLLPVLDFGGIESRAVIQARSMVNDYPGLRFCCFTNAGWAAHEIRKLGVPVDVLETSPSVRSPASTWRLWRYLRSRRPDVLHTCSGAMTIHGLVAGWAARVPVRIAEEIGIPSRGRIGRRIFPLVYRLATAVIGVAEAVVDYLIEHDGLPPEKARLIYNVIEDRFFEARSRSTSDGRFQILTAGRLVRIKGHDVLLLAFAKVAARQPGLALQVVGDGQERESLEGMARELGIEDRVEFLGYRTDVPDLMAASDAFVLPSRSEGLALAVIEAMAVGVPVIATRVGGTSEAVPAWADEWLVPGDDVPALAAAIDKMSRLTKEDRNVMGNRLRNHAKLNFRADQYAVTLGQLYDQQLAALEAR